jgi:ATP-dependent Clp protease protease subunit
MFDGNEFKKYATKHMGLNSVHVANYIESSLTPYIIEERPLNMTQMDVFSRLMMDRILFLGTGIYHQCAIIVFRIC